jgi:hypothetical protein
MMLVIYMAAKHANAALAGYSSEFANLSLPWYSRGRYSHAYRQEIDRNFNLFGDKHVQAFSFT